MGLNGIKNSFNSRSKQSRHCVPPKTLDGGHHQAKKKLSIGRFENSNHYLTINPTNSLKFELIFGGLIVAKKIRFLALYTSKSCYKASVVKHNVGWHPKMSR